MLNSMLMLHVHYGEAGAWLLYHPHSRTQNEETATPSNVKSKHYGEGSESCPSP